jgi:sulfonate transport system substrate-binding protein
MECWSNGVLENGSVSDRTVDRAVGSPSRPPFRRLQPATRVQFGLGAILPHSNTPARNASRSDAGGPSLRVAGFEDEDEYEGTYPGLKPWAILFNRFAVFLCALVLTLVSPTQAEDQKLSSVRIGYQKYGTLNVLKAEGSLEKSLSAKGITVTWTLFSAGPQLLEALNAGSIDFGNTGEAPPVFAQAAGVNLVYFGNQPPYPKGEGVLVKKDSPIRGVSDLKGKRIALNKGSNVHFFLVKLLEKNGLKIDDIRPVYLTPADAWAALEGGSIDAWVIWDPYMSAAIDRSGARVLQDAEGVAANREFFLADRRFAEAHQEVLLAVRDAVGRCGTWVATKPQEVVSYLAPQLGMSEQVISKVIQAQPWGFQPITEQVVSDQQTVSDTFFSLKLIPKTIRVSEAVVRIPD